MGSLALMFLLIKIAVICLTAAGIAIGVARLIGDLRE